MTRINPINLCNSISVSKFDYEYIQIIKKLAQYGIRPTGCKSTDKAKLREIELRLVEKESHPSSKFLTVSIEEQEKILAKKKEKKVAQNPEKIDSLTNGQEILGEQMLVIVNMNKKIKD